MSRNIFKKCRAS